MINRPPEPEAHRRERIGQKQMSAERRNIERRLKRGAERPNDRARLQEIVGRQATKGAQQ